MRKALDNIIKESIDDFIAKDSRTKRTSINEVVRNCVDKFLVTEGFFESDDNQGDGSKKNIKYKKKSGGKTQAYDYDQYERDNPHVSDSDANQIIGKINTDYLDLSKVAQKVFPDHTKEGAQSQLRKIMNGERPMDMSTANKLKKKISAGELPTS